MATGLLVGVTGGDADTFVGNRTAVAGVVFDLNDWVDTFVPRFSNSISVASFESIDAALFRLVLKLMFFVVVAVGVIFVVVVVSHTVVKLLLVVVRDFGATKLSVSINRRVNVGGAGTANEF